MRPSPEHAPSAPKAEIPRNVVAKFDTLEEAVAFVKAFWMAVDTSVGERIADRTAEELTEYTWGDRTALRPYPSALYDGKFGVMVYPNSDTNPLSDKAIAFLRSTKHIQ